MFTFFPTLLSDLCLHETWTHRETAQEFFSYISDWGSDPEGGKAAAASGLGASLGSTLKHPGEKFTPLLNHIFSFVAIKKHSFIRS